MLGTSFYMILRGRLDFNRLRREKKSASALSQIPAPPSPEEYLNRDVTLPSTFS